VTSTIAFANGLPTSYWSRRFVIRFVDQDSRCCSSVSLIVFLRPAVSSHGHRHPFSLQLDGKPWHPQLRADFHKEFVLAGLLVDSAYCCDVYGNCVNVKMCEDFAPNFGEKRTYRCIMTMHRLTLLFSPGNFWPKATWLSSSTHPSFLFPPLQIKLKGRHFDTTEVIEAESQAVLNALTEHVLQDAFKKNGRSSRSCAYGWKGNTSRVIVASRTVVRFWLDGSTLLTYSERPPLFGEVRANYQSRKL
jgi:hypothetical protein